MPDVNKQIGDILAATRREQKKSLSDVSEGTRIMAKYLEAVEAGDQSRLPSPAYFPLFSRSYAQYLGLDPRVIEEILETDSGETAGEKSGEAKTPPDESESHRQARSFAKTLTVIIILAIVAFAIILIVRQLGQRSENQTGVSEHQTEEPESLGAGDNIVPELADSNTTLYESPEPLSLHWDIKQDVWAVVIRDGDTVLNRELKAGEQRSWEANYRFRLTLGISTAVEMTLNGQRLAPLSDRPRAMSNIEINQVNYKQFLADENRIGESETQAGKASPTSRPDSIPGPAGDDLSRGHDGD